MMEFIGGVGEDVAVVGQEDLVVLEEGTYPPQPLTDGGADPGVHEGDPPLTDVTAQHLHLGAALGQHEVVGLGLPVAQEVVLHRLGTEAEAQDEVGVPEVCVVPHDVPQHGPVADRHHGLGKRVRTRAHSHPESTAEEDDLHPLHLLSSGILTAGVPS